VRGDCRGGEERSDERVPLGRERERRGSGVWAGSGRAGPAGSRVRPKWAAGPPLLFFSFCFLFLLFLISVLEF
jgi:hypothetical protein